MKRAVLLVSLFACAGCGGGGGGSSSALPSATQGPAAGGTLSTSVQRGLVQQSLTSTQTSAQVASYGAPSGSSGLGVMRRIAARERVAQGTTGCVGGVIETTAPGASSNETLVTINAYYDASCTKLFVGSQFDLVVTAPGAGTATGAATSYTTAGTVYEYDKLALTISGAGTSSGYFSLRDDVAPNAQSAPVANIGIGCSIAPSSDSCSIAAALHLAGLSLDDAAFANATSSVSVANGATTVGLSGNGAAYTGGLGATNVAAQGNFGWAVIGGTQVDAVTLSGSLAYAAGGLLTGGSLKVTDAADGATVVATYSAPTQSIVGSVTLTGSGTTVATFTVNPAGSGTVTYGNGTIATISNWIVLS